MGLRGLELTTSWSSSQPSNHWAKVTSWQVSANFAIRVKIKSMAWFIHCVVLKIELLCLGLGHGHDCCLRHRLSHHLLANTASLFTMARKTLFAFTLTNDNWRIWFLDLSFSLFNNKRHSRSSKTFKIFNLKIWIFKSCFVYIHPPRDRWTNLLPVFIYYFFHILSNSYLS